jgi:hypothetical protein
MRFFKMQSYRAFFMMAWAQILPTLLMTSQAVRNYISGIGMKC